MKETFGERVRNLRIDKKLKQEQVAAALQVNRKAVSHYENGVREPSFEILIRLSEMFHVSTDYLLGIETKHVIEVSGLTDKEIRLIQELVSDLEELNKRLGRKPR